MTSASYSRPRPVAGVEAAVAVLRAEGHRLSAMRRMILEGLVEAEGPVSAELLASRIGGEGESPDLASVYRNLELLERLGLARHVHIGHGPGLYSLVAEGERAYLVCERCGGIDRLPAEEVGAIRARISEVSGYEAHFSHFPILGLCGDCAANRDRDAAAEPQGKDRGRASEEHSHRDRIHSHPHTHRPGAAHRHD